MHSWNTTIVTSHDIDSALNIADTLWIIGRQRDEKGQIIPGASIRREVNLIEMGIAWQQNKDKLPEYQALRAEIRELFNSL